MLAFFVYLNIWWIHGCHLGGYIYATDMSEAYYKKIVGQFQIDERDRKFLDVEEDFTGNKKNRQIIYFNNFLHDTKFTSEINHTQKLHLQKQTKADYYFPIGIKKVMNRWLRFNAKIQMIQPNWDPARMSMMGIQFKQDRLVIKENRILLDRLFYKNSNQLIWVDIKVPQEKFNQINVFFKNDSIAQGEFLIDSISVESFE